MLPSRLLSSGELALLSESTEGPSETPACGAWPAAALACSTRSLLPVMSGTMRLGAARVSVTRTALMRASPSPSGTKPASAALPSRMPIWVTTLSATSWLRARLARASARASWPVPITPRPVQPETTCTASSAARLAARCRLRLAL